MKNLLAVTLTDGYKLGHKDQYPKGTEVVYANWTPRANDYYPEAHEGAVVFGVQHFIKKYLIDYFNKNFFGLSKDEACKPFKELISKYLNTDYDISHIEELHDLGYLPLEIKSLPEGDICPIRCPMLTIKNTHPQFFWLTNYLETLISTELWLPMVSATTARLYKKNLIEHFNNTTNETFVDFNVHDFSMRSMAGLEASQISGMAHLTSFMGTETIPAIEMVQNYYGGQGAETIAGTIPATEHSVMCAGGKLDEFETFKRLITETYPKGLVSIVSDTWDFWAVLGDILPRLKDEIMSRDGRLVIRPDSGDPVDIICGIKNYVGDITNYICDPTEDVIYSIGDDFFDFIDSCGFFEIEKEGVYVVRCNNIYYDVRVCYDIYEESYYVYEVIESKLTDSEIKGAYEILWETFGGKINEKGFKELDSHIGLIYGDSITLERQKQIYEKLELKGFSATNLVLGIGGYTYQYKTRDSLGFAMKSTYCEINGEEKIIFKDPKTDSGLKRSLKGLIKVIKNDKGRYEYIDQVSKKDEQTGCLETVFLNGELKRKVDIYEIRERINDSLK